MFSGIGERVAAIERPANQSHTLGLLFALEMMIYSVTSRSEMMQRINVMYMNLCRQTN